MSIDFDKLGKRAASALADIKYPEHPRTLYRPVEYTLASGGKHLRPALCLAACEALCGDADRAISQAMAVEMFHNFTLIHDDLMDKSDTRRGRSTVYAQWGSVQAVLSGDALLTLATAAACRGAGAERLEAVLGLFNDTALRIYEGQQYDMDFEDRPDVTVGEYLDMIRLKTSVLLGCACRMGALMADAPEDSLQAMYEYGENLGVAFQLRDDWLDTFGDPLVFGKNIGGDIVNRKKTWLFITAMNEAPDRLAAAISDNPGKADLIAAVTEVYNSLDLSTRCDSLINKYCDKAIDALDRTKMDAADRDAFAALARKLCLRQN